PLETPPPPPPEEPSTTEPAEVPPGPSEEGPGEGEFVPVVPTGEPDGSVGFRPAGQGWAARPRRSRVRIAAWILVPLLLLVGAWFGLQAYLDRQWYVGVADGNVAIYQGIPAEVLGYELHELVERTDLPAGLAAQLTPWSEIESGITANGEQEARDIVARIREDLERQSGGEAP
ncbi:MAG: hypothetical protein HY658_02040, partial [Actinobacteria bacterium]|nr:hypothetical protein [Actinomycetota bacterium]